MAILPKSGEKSTPGVFNLWRCQSTRLFFASRDLQILGGTVAFGYLLGRQLKLHGEVRPAQPLALKLPING
jgi:hypothetical protein